MMPVSPIIRNETPIRIIVDQDRSSMAPMRAKSVSFRILKAIAAEVPCARKKVSAARMCRKINHRIMILTIVVSLDLVQFAPDQGALFRQRIAKLGQGNKFTTRFAEYFSR